MQRLPRVSLFFFAAPAVFLAVGFWQKTATSSRAIRQQEVSAPADADQRRRAAVETMRRRIGGAIDYDAAFDPRRPYSVARRDANGSGERRTSIFDPQDAYWGLPRTTGHELVAGLCGGCHSLEIVMQQRMTSDRWAYTLDWMVEEQGMTAPSPEQRDVIFTYLTTHFSTHGAD